MLIKASNGLIADNIIDGPSFGGIVLSPDYESLFLSIIFYSCRLIFLILCAASDSEGDFSQNVTIQGNWLRNVDYFPRGSGWGAIFINSQIYNQSSQPPPGVFSIFPAMVY